MAKSIVWVFLFTLFLVIAGYGRGIGDVWLFQFSITFGVCSLAVLFLQFRNWQQMKCDTESGVIRELDPKITYKVINYGYNYSTFVMQLMYCDSRGVEHFVEFRRQYSPLASLQYGFLPADLNIKVCGGETFIAPGDEN